MLEESKPAHAIVEKLFDLFHEFADRPAAGGSIGSQLSALVLPQNPTDAPWSEYYSASRTPRLFVPASVQAIPGQLVAAMDQIEITVSSTDGSEGIARVPKVGRNAPCPCGSSRKYKVCHGRDYRRST
jgi:hypothetical protein